MSGIVERPGEAVSRSDAEVSPSSQRPAGTEVAHLAVQEWSPEPVKVFWDSYRPGSSDRELIFHVPCNLSAGEEYHHTEVSEVPVNNSSGRALDVGIYVRVPNPATPCLPTTPSFEVPVLLDDPLGDREVFETTRPVPFPRDLPADNHRD
jgi:hypothetical protein